MLKINEQKFSEMDELSLKKVPFFFVIDFLMENVLVFSQEDLEAQKILVDFPNFKNIQPFTFETKEVTWKSFPQSEEDYQKGFRIVQNHLKLGDSYLVNYTCETPIETNLSLEEIFYRSEAKYKVLLPKNFTFFSPETFVEIKNQEIFTHPMKGTIEAYVPNAVDELKNSVKEKAEHYTVVDLLRNDLSMVADWVKLDEFQRIDFLKTRNKNLYAMSSEISGKVKPEFQNKIGSLMKTLLPAGSILGAPKPKTLEIILEAETYERGFYTGVCGYFDGENLDSCVMIRFIQQNGENLTFRSGGGITHLSKLADEYQEMKNKIYVPIH
ncbi:MAG: aminodeoxychorismate synthase component I [Cloacibacterium caeni]